MKHLPSGIIRNSTTRTVQKIVNGLFDELRCNANNQSIWQNSYNADAFEDWKPHTYR